MAPQLRCQKCGYVWEYTGSLQKATCPSCSAKVPVESEEVGDSIEELADEFGLTVAELEEVLRRARAGDE